jgi:hypothetical protein
MQLAALSPAYVFSAESIKPFPEAPSSDTFASIARKLLPDAMVCAGNCGAKVVVVAADGIRTQSLMHVARQCSPCATRAIAAVSC